MNILIYTFIGLITLFGGIAYQETQEVVIVDEQTVGAFGDPFLSIQLASSPQSGYILETDGTNNSWVANSGGGGGSTLHADGGGFVYPLDGDYHTAPYYIATSSTASDFQGLVARASSTITSTLTVTGGVIGNADTATALSANGANCTSGNAPLGVDTAGAVEGCFDVWTEAENTSAAYIANVVEDTTPQLGGALDAQGNNITDLGDVTFQTGASGGTLRTGTSNADKYELQAYDVNDSVYRKVLEVDAGNEPQLEVFADSFAIWDNADETKQLFFTLSGGATGVTTEMIHSPTANRQITLPDATDTLVGKATTDTLTNKTLNLTSNTLTGTAAQFDVAVSDDNFAYQTDLHSAVTLSGTPDYITLSGQDIIRGLINLTTDVTGTLPIANGGTGQTSFTNDTVLTINGSGAFTSSSTVSSAFIEDAFVLNTGDVITGSSTITANLTVAGNDLILEGISADIVSDSDIDLYPDGQLTRSFRLSDSGSSIQISSTGANVIDFADSVNLISGQNLTVVDGTIDFGGGTSLEIPNNGTVNANGEITTDDTSGQLRYYAGSAERVIAPTKPVSVSYASTTQGAATTTVYLGTLPYGITVDSVRCDFSNFMGISLYDGTNRANYIEASSTVNLFEYTTNNTFTTGETIRVDVGTTTDIAADVRGQCTFNYSITAD
jgi:hypothetical protein